MACLKLSYYEADNPLKVAYRSSEKLEKKQIEQKNSKNNVDSLLSNITEWIFKFFNRWIICWALRNR